MARMASRGRIRFFEVAAIYTLDTDALQAAREFLQHKIWAAEYAREQIRAHLLNPQP